MSKTNVARRISALITSRRSRRVVEADRRSSERKACDDVTVSLIDDEGALVPFNSFDLNASGVYLRSELLMYAGDEVMLQLTIPGCQEPLIVVGEVVRVDPDDFGTNPGMGISFWSLTRPERAILSNFLETK